MQQIHVLMHLSFVLLGNKWQMMGRVRRRIQVRLWILEFAQDRPAVNVVKHVVIFVGLTWKPSVVQKNVLQALAVLGLRFNSDGQSPSSRGGSQGGRAER